MGKRTKESYIQGIKTRHNNGLSWHSVEARKKIGKGNKGRRFTLPESAKRKISESNRRRKITIKTKEKTRKSIKKLYSNGFQNGMLGRKHTEETKQKMSENSTMKERTGEKNPAWKGGKSFEIYPEEFNENLKEQMKKRDNYQCQECGLHQDELKGYYKKLDTHHIDYNKKNNNPKNLITLCRSCHTKTGFKRKDWTNYFQNKSYLL